MTRPAPQQRAATVVRLIARREIVTRFQQKGYRIGLIVSAVLAIVAVIVPSFFGGGNPAKSYTIGLVGAQPALQQALHAQAADEHARVTVHQAGDVAQARTQVKDGHWDAAVDGNTLIVQRSNDAVVAFAQRADTVAQLVTNLRNAGLNDQQAQQALSVQPLSVSATKSGAETQRQTIALVTIILLFSQLVTFCTWVAMGVVEEKSSRVVELLLSSIRPVQLLAGKLIGIGVLAAGQVLVLGTAAIVAAKLAGTVSLPVGDLAVVLVGFVAFVLGFAFFASMSAGLASTVSRQEEVSGVMAPVTVLLMICYGMSFSIPYSTNSHFASVISVIPPVSCIAMPGRLARGGVPVGQILLAIALLLVLALAVLRLAARIYRASVLHQGSRLSLRDAWRGEAVGETAA